MTSLLRPLSAAFLVVGVTVGGYALLQGRNGAHLRPAIGQIVGQGQVALRSFIESAQANRTQFRDPKPEADEAKLPFIVIEPRDFAAPAIKLPSHELARVQQPQQQLSDLRLTQSPDREQLDLNPVEARLRARVPNELIAYFDLFLYVSKATKDKGDWGQTMFVLAKEHDQLFKLLYNWPVSTGLEEAIPAPSGKMLGTNTPQGIFKLDRDRFYEDYTSNQWDTPMPHAMFFDWQTEGRTSGLAIHGTDAQGAKTLGKRASHGCIRLSPDNARILFELIQSNYRGRVPVFQVNPGSGTMSTTGALMRDADGDVVMTRGYKVLVFIEDYGGPSVDTVAALY